MKILIQERDIDILCITETWLLPHTPDHYISILDFNIFRCDNGRGAGACIYVRDILKSEVLSVNIIRPTNIEDIWISVQCRKLPAITVGCVYRHPKALAISYDYKPLFYPR